MKVTSNLHCCLKLLTLLQTTFENDDLHAAYRIDLDRNFMGSFKMFTIYLKVGLLNNAVFEYTIHVPFFIGILNNGIPIKGS
jgi:hypothetical protein